MNESRNQQMEAAKILDEFLGRLIPNLRTLSQELKGNRKPDTDAFQKQCMDALNWVIEVYNRIPDVMELSEKRLDKSVVNRTITELAEALKSGEDTVIAGRLEDGISHFLVELKAILEEISITETSDKPDPNVIKENGAIE